MVDSIALVEAVAGVSNTLEVVKVAGSIGAEIRGVSLAKGLDDETVARIRATLLEHKVIFFRGQHDLDDAGQEAFAARFGELQKHPMVAAAGSSEALMELTEGYSASVWHTDLTFVTEPSAFAVLRPIALPEFGGDTLWANAANAYRLLPGPLRLLADNLWAIHATNFDFDGAFNDAYKARFGFPFIFAVKGATKHMILEAFEARVKNDPDTEFATAIAQVCRIFRFRLEDRVAP